MPKNDLKFNYDISYTQNRELSWLKFNERVLEEAQDETVPLYERLKFVSIFTSNLDEFFMVRVGSITDLTLLKKTHIDNKTGMTAEEQLQAIYKNVAPLYKMRDKIYNQIMEQMKQHDIYSLTIKDLEGKEKKFVENYFDSYIMPVLSPQIVDSRHPFPHLVNKTLNICVLFKKEQELFGIIPVPQSLPSFVMMPGSSTRYILTERIILEYANKVFNMPDIQSKTIMSVTRNADIDFYDEVFDDDNDFRKVMKKVIKKRARLAPIRLEVQSDTDSKMISYLCTNLNLKKEQVFKSKAPLLMKHIFSLEDKFPLSVKKSLSYKPFEPQISANVDLNKSMMEQLRQKDVLLHYPYESMKPFLNLLKEASTDPDVVSIKITIYRLAKKSKLVEYLSSAAENGKEVTVLMELRARFDEQNNIDWSEILEEAGCTVIYGFEGYKVHSKICLITRMSKGNVEYFTQIGTGNYNENTSKLYTDLSLMTSNYDIGLDAAEFFKNMSISNLQGSYEHLLVAPVGIKPGIKALIDKEIQKAKEGKPNHIMMKMNSFTDRDILTKLAEASSAGVKIDLIIRGICCILPDINSKTSNITVRSIVGRYLEHSRVYCFGEGDDMVMYIASADMMTRNTEKRVEIACPIVDNDIKKQIYDILTIMFKDNTKARILQKDGNFIKQKTEDKPINAQQYFMDKAIKDRAKRELIEIKEKENLKEKERQKIREELKREIKEEIKEEFIQKVEEKKTENKKNPQKTVKDTETTVKVKKEYKRGFFDKIRDLFK